MKIAITSNNKLPVEHYGGTERVIWCLAKNLSLLGHEVYLIAPTGSKCDFAEVLIYSEYSDIRNLTLDKIDIVHYNSPVNYDLNIPYIITVHGNVKFGQQISRQAVFVSQNHASRYGSCVYVHNGIDCDINLTLSSFRNHFHFLGKAAWRKKNVRGAIKCAKKAGYTKIDILGGTRLNFSMGFRFTPDSHALFHGMVDNNYKNTIMSKSRGLVFPVRWNEPFGLAITESLLAGCPVFGTPYGSLPELIPNEVGFLSAKSDELSEAMNNSGQWKPKDCRDFAIENFSSRKMALKYLEIYERVLAGEILNKSVPTLQKQEPKLLPFE